ncbi:MAG: ATP-binding protein [Azospirillum sp.]|nr:ATP-binding protein [Azospirillum sp.]
MADACVRKHAERNRERPGRDQKQHALHARDFDGAFDRRRRPAFRRGSGGNVPGRVAIRSGRGRNRIDFVERTQIRRLASETDLFHGGRRERATFFLRNGNRGSRVRDGSASRISRRRSGRRLRPRLRSIEKPDSEIRIRGRTDMQTVRVPKSFFKKERDQFYADWAVAFWRELMQNAIDAGARHLTVEISGSENAPKVRFADDGSGMDAQTLENVFFELGASAKTDDGVSMGGFGRARLLTCFSQKSYSIRTRNLSVRGDGGTYSISTVPENVEGCVFDIETDGTTASRLISSLRMLLASCSEDVAVAFSSTIPGREASETLVGTLRNARTRRLLRDANGKPFAALKSLGRDLIGDFIAVRCLGLTTFVRRVPGLGNPLALEIEPGRVREVLVGNRDSFKGEFQVVFDDVVRALSQNRRKALSNEAASVKIAYGSSSKPFVSKKAPESGLGKRDVSASHAGSGRHVEAAIPNADAGLDRDSAPVEESSIDLSENGNGTPPSMIGVDHPIVMQIENPPKSHRRSIREFDPEKWTEDTGRNVRMLLATWRECVSSAIEALLASGAAGDQERISWMVGWHFGDCGAIALRRESGGIHSFLLAPLDDDGMKRFKRNDRETQLKLMAYAQHEVAHVLFSDHDENFAAALTQISAHFDQKKTFAAILEALARIPLSKAAARAADTAADTSYRDRANRDRQKPDGKTRRVHRPENQVADIGAPDPAWRTSTRPKTPVSAHAPVGGKDIVSDRQAAESQVLEIENGAAAAGGRKSVSQEEVFERFFSRGF